MSYTLHLGDCLEILPTLTGIDAVVTDPPYGISYDASHSKYKNGIERAEATWDVSAYDPAPILALGKPTIMWGGNCFASRLPDHPGWLCWVKTVRDGAEIRQADMELAWTNCIRRSQTIRHLWIGAYRDSESGIKNVHPTQKPIRVMKWCIQLCSKPGDTILDPYMGSGTTGVACLQMGRNFIGVERDPNYFAIAQRRIEDAAAQPMLFDAAQGTSDAAALGKFWPSLAQEPDGADIFAGVYPVSGEPDKLIDDKRATC